MSTINDQSDTNIPGCITCHIPIRDMINLHNLAKEAINPKVVFTGNMEEMEKEASNITKQNLINIEIILKKLINI